MLSRILASLVKTKIDIKYLNTVSGKFHLGKLMNVSASNKSKEISNQEQCYLPIVHTASFTACAEVDDPVRQGKMERLVATDASLPNTQH